MRSHVVQSIDWRQPSSAIRGVNASNQAHATSYYDAFENGLFAGSPTLVSDYARGLGDGGVKSGTFQL